jgi:hypothetical protein
MNVNRSFGFTGGFSTLWFPSLIATCPPQMHVEKAFDVCNQKKSMDGIALQSHEYMTDLNITTLLSNHTIPRFGLRPAKTPNRQQHSNNGIARDHRERQETRET